ncbi:MAG TPA: polyprenyl synthetase family protein [Kiritimatiellia bacterium]|jgi:geranylgeranyl diphosphate synthase type II|nr:polyprenyl synthetase family protein [Kiritimatiellia bacterium]HOR97673.1 polyprenyl synthetase family protein [Kiritimatiellia bacterium]HPC49247.1 polyprenyl synthetase family protein [Kiritimatiellia bacterium]HPK37597.1 polyprenyl synthetase family protein [Kiritimatiellia bacterium]HPW74826.1 polyprenyl synthetase family protein [Kiritimatiellia bacterium]
MEADLEVYLTERRRLVEEHLSACLPEATPRNKRLIEAMCHAVLSGGKRLRPILCLAAAEASGGSLRDALCPASAVELLHTYTLVHDDLPCMDNDPMRRGQPTVHAKFGEALGVLTGDALQTLAFEILARTPEKQAGTLQRLVTELASAAGQAGVIAGQAEDIRCAAAPTRADIEYVFRHKTADLFRTACRLGAIAANAAAPDLERLTEYGDGLGFAFQILDDLLDAHEAKTRAEPELSCLAVMTVAEAREWAENLTQQAVAALAGLPGETAPLEALARHLLGRLA